VGPDGTVVWVGGGSLIHFVGPGGTNIVDITPRTANVVAADMASGGLYWAGQDAIGFMHFDGTGQITSPQVFGGRPTELFAARGATYWSLQVSPPTVVSYCAFASEAGCVARDLGSALAGRTANDGVVANSREVLSIIHSLDSMFPSPELLTWRSPYAGPGM
jgi:hypothetical protein